MVDRRALGALLASAAILASLVGAVSPASAADRPMSDVSESKWKKIWAEVGAPGTADSWQCYGRPQQVDRDPSWVVVPYRAAQTDECAGLPSDPYPGLVRKVSGKWQFLLLVGPIDCEYLSEEVLAAGGSWGIVRDLMASYDCWSTGPMWTAYMDRFLNTRLCVKPSAPQVNKSVVGYIGRVEQSMKVIDGAVAWTCARGSGGAQEQFLSVFLAGPVPVQLITALDMDQFESLKIRGSRIHVTGGAYSGDGPKCCPDLRVTVQYKMRDGELVEVDKTVTPIE